MTESSASRPKFFATPAAFRRWLERNHDKATELWVGYYKKASGKPTITWQESVDQALCFGWIDGIRKSCDDESYTNRFTPRRAGSVWSTVNTKRANELIELGLMHEAGKAAFEKRDEKKTALYSFEQRGLELDPDMEKQFRANKKAWAFFQSLPASYRKRKIWWIVSAKQEATRQKRLAQAIKDSAAGERPDLMTPKKTGKRQT
jgi:uncharacterized protein YdeI (YjbR/CyaY-like superfamily)